MWNFKGILKGTLNQSHKFKSSCVFFKCPHPHPHPTRTINDTVSSLKIQWNPSGKARNVSLKLQNLVHFHEPFFTNHVYFTPHDRPPLLKGHHVGWPLRWVAFIEGFHCIYMYCQISNISGTSNNKIVDHSDVAGTSTVRTVPTTSSLLTYYMASMDWAKTTSRRDEMRNMWVLGFGAPYIRDLTVHDITVNTVKPLPLRSLGFTCAQYKWDPSHQVYRAERKHIVFV